MSTRLKGSTHLEQHGSSTCTAPNSKHSVSGGSIVGHLSKFFFNPSIGIYPVFPLPLKSNTERAVSTDRSTAVNSLRRHAVFHRHYAHPSIE